MKSFYVFESEDGKFSRRAEIGRGSVLAVQEEVLAYEESQKDPLAKLMLPWRTHKEWGGVIIRADAQSWNAGISDIRPIVSDTMNLLPLLREWRDMVNDAAVRNALHDSTQKLLLAYEEIEKKAKEL